MKIKRILYLAFFLTCLNSTMKGQESLTFIQLNTLPYSIDGTYRAVVDLSIGKLNQNHGYSVGLTMLYASDIVSSNENYPKLSGLQFQYSYYPNGHENRWNVYLFSKLMIQNINDEWTTISWVDESSRYEEFKYLSREVLATSFFGYGLHFNLSERFVLSQSIGAGFYYSFLDGDEITANAPEVSETFGASYKSLGVVLGANFGVKYVFGEKEKK